MNKGARITLVVSGALAAALAALLLSAGGLAFWGNSQKDDQGYVASDAHRLEADGRALTSGNIDANFEGSDWVFDAIDLDEAKLEVESRAGEPVFVGVARTADVADYLRGVAHTEVTNVDDGPFDDFSVDYEAHAGSERAAAPAKSDIWVASEQGSGRQTLEWKVNEGDWSVVVMNADGSRGVDADISAGVKIDYLTALAWSLAGTGAVVMAIGIWLLVLGIRRPGGPSGTAPATDATAVVA
jgi:hypothetical protein